MWVSEKSLSKFLKLQLKMQRGKKESNRENIYNVSIREIFNRGKY